MQPDIGGGVSLIYAEVCVYIQPMPKGVRVHVSPAFGRELVAVRGSGETGDIGDSVVEFSTVRSRQRRHRMFVADRRKGGAQ